jgi:hypothetical protein
MLNALFNFFSHNQSICEVRLSGNAFTSEGIANIINRMGSAPSLKLLDLRNTICNDGGKPFVFNPTRSDAPSYPSQSFKDLHFQIEIEVNVPQELCADESGRIKKRNADLSEVQDTPYSMLIDSHYGFQRKAHEKGLLIQAVSRDGDGFFRTVADQLVRQGIDDSLLAPDFYPGYSLHMRLRLCAVDYIKQNREYFVEKYFNGKRMELSNYIAKMQESGTWPDRTIKCALADSLKISLHFYEERHKSDPRMMGIEEDFYIDKINPRRLNEEGLPQIRLGYIKSIGYYSSILISEADVAVQPGPAQIVSSSGGQSNVVSGRLRVDSSLPSSTTDRSKKSQAGSDRPSLSTSGQSNVVSGGLRVDSSLPSSTTDRSKKSQAGSDRPSLSTSGQSNAVSIGFNSEGEAEAANKKVREEVNREGLGQGREESQQNLTPASGSSIFQKSLSFFQERERTSAADASGKAHVAVPRAEVTEDSSQNKAR